MHRHIHRSARSTPGWALIALLVCLSGSPAWAQQEIAVAVTPTAGELTESVAEALLASSKSQLEALPADAAEGSEESNLRRALQRQIALIEEFRALIAAVKVYETEQGELAQREQSAKAALASTEAPQTPASTPPTKEALDRLEAELSDARDRAAAVRREMSEAQARLQGGVEQAQEVARARAADAQRLARGLAQEFSAATDDVQRRQLQASLTAARYEQVVAQKVQETLDAESAVERAAEPVRALESELLERNVSALEARFGVLAEALQAQLESEQARASDALERTEKAAEQAETPADRFLAQWQTELARSKKNDGELQTFVVPLKKDVAEQEKRLAAENEEQATLRNLISRSGTAGSAGERISRALGQLKRRKSLVDRTLQSGVLQRLPALRERRFEIEDMLISLGEPFTLARDEIAAELEQGTAQQSFVTRSNELVSELRSALRAERVTLGEAIGLGSQLQALLTQRRDTLNGLERFIRSRAFWLRDGKPLAARALAPIPRETSRLRAWVTDLGSEETRNAVAARMTTGSTVFFALLLFPVLPIVLYWARQRVRAVTRSVNDRVVAEGRRPALLLTTLVTGLVSAALVPAYFLLAARFVASMGLPVNVGPVLSAALQHTGLFLFLWFLSRSFFHGRGIAEVQFGMPRPAANDFFRAFRWFLLSYLLWLTPWQILLAAPFSFEALPRLAYLAFMVTAFVGVRALVRPNSSFIAHRLAQLGDNAVVSWWPNIAKGIYLGALVIIALDVVGYRYASRATGTSLLQSLAVLVALPPLYQAIQSLLQGVSRRRDNVMKEVSGGDESQDADVLARVQTFARLFFVILCVALLAVAWGFDQQALQTLDEMNVYTVRGVGDAQEFVTGGDLVRFVIIVVGMFWLLKAVPGVYEFAVFPRLNVDAGVKYAALTITRYGVFVLGIVLALAEIHLDLGRLGWLMAAIGVGLGFGLQEIVSNFVSGLILLIERPVRPGDVVTVGGMTGTVQRINIRATTIVNFDRQEVMVPNRSLITGEVTNWTRGDNVNRVVISIGVAYGSDVEQVTELFQRIATEQPEVLDDPAPQVFFMNHGESSLDFEIRCFVPSPSEMLRVRDRINKQLNRELAEQGIEIPFPQRDLNIRSGLETLQEARTLRQTAG